jgi:hypothetical protein
MPEVSLAAQPECRDDRHLASILGLSFETLEALISGHPAFVPKLTRCETIWTM